MKKNKVPDHYPIVRCVDVPEQQLWAHDAFFGGRIETTHARQGIAPTDR
jgi:hypothetical protein